MTINADIQAAMRSVLTTLGASWTYRALTSARDAETRTYGTPAAMTVHKVSEQNGLEFDDKKGAWVRRVRATIKVTDATALVVGDQAIDPDGKHWHVDGSSDGSAIDGITRYALSREIPIKGGADRGGGV